MEILFSYQSADFDKNYAKHDGEYSRNLVQGCLLLQEDKAKDSPDYYGGLPNRCDIAGLSLGKQVVD